MESFIYKLFCCLIVAKKKEYCHLCQHHHHTNNENNRFQHFCFEYILCFKSTFNNNMNNVSQRPAYLYFLWRITSQQCITITAECFPQFHCSLEATTKKNLCACRNRSMTPNNCSNRIINVFWRDENIGGHAAN